MKLCEKKDCVGCFACKNICPKEAIKVELDDMQKTVPGVDEQKCVNCGLCEKVCPVINDSNFREIQKCYASWTKVEPDRIDCASGGIATAFARSIIAQDGVVFGTAYDKDGKPCIMMAETEKELESFKGSKYVQSDTIDSYKKAKQQLDGGKLVLYVATPCQIDGLLHFLRKAYDNLITVDIICHGVPPFTYLKEYLKQIMPDKQIANVTFRGKYDFEICCMQNEEIIYKKPSYKDKYYHAFLKGLIYRDNCYQCQYARKERISDITIGDFWGLDKKTLKEKYNGKISSILVNTEKGKGFLENCGSYLMLEERNIEEALQYNEQLNHPMIPHKDREKFCRSIKNGLDINTAINKTKIGFDVKLNYIKDCKFARKVKRIIKRNG